MRAGALRALVTGLWLLGSAGLPADAAPKAGGTLKVALLRDPTGWDPHINYGATTYSFQANVYEGLLRYSLKGVLEPGLAVRWETPNLTTYVLHLRKGVRFHSGNLFTADDVKWNIERIQAPATNATRAKEFEVIETVTVVDPSTVRITLKQPSAPFLELLAAGEAMIADSKWVAGGGDLKKAASGTGPFKLGPYETGVRYALVKNPDYWESPFPYLDRIELSTVAKDDVRVQALQTGSVDLAEYIPWQEIKALEKDPQIKVHVGYDTFYTAFFGTGGASYARAVEFSDAPLDKLLAEARGLTDQPKRAAVYAQVEQRVVELAPWVFLHWRPQAEAHRATIGGYTRLPGALGNKSLGGLKYVYREG